MSKGSKHRMRARRLHRDLLIARYGEHSIDSALRHMYSKYAAAFWRTNRDFDALLAEAAASLPQDEAVRWVAKEVTFPVDL